MSDLFGALSPESRRLIEALIQQLVNTQTEIPLNEIDYQAYIPSWIGYILCRGLSPATVRKYKRVVSEFLPLFPQPSKVFLDTFLIMKHMNGSGPGWLNFQIDALRSFFGYLKKEGFIKDDPSRDLDRVKIPQRERSIPTTKDVSALLAHVEAKDKLLILLMIDCGLRVSEVCGIRLSDLDLRECELRVIGKGNKERRLPMSIITRDAIESYLAGRKRESAYLFPHRHKECPMYPQSVDERMGVLCRKAGVAHITPHQLRHFFASVMVKDGANLSVVSRLLGHQDIRTTMIYVHTDEEMKRKEHEQHNPLKRIAEAK